MGRFQRVPAGGGPQLKAHGQSGLVGRDTSLSSSLPYGSPGAVESGGEGAVGHGAEEMGVGAPFNGGVRARRDGACFAGSADRSGGAADAGSGLGVAHGTEEVGVLVPVYATFAGAHGWGGKGGHGTREWHRRRGRSSPSVDVPEIRGPPYLSLGNPQQRATAPLWPMDRNLGPPLFPRSCTRYASSRFYWKRPSSC
jgi:hypothetical protein